MEITISKAEGRVPVSIIQMKGDLDGSSYKDLIATAQMLYDEGDRQLLLDLSRLDFISSAGLAALHIVTRMFHGETPPNPEEGWATFHDMGKSPTSGSQANVKLLKPTEKILGVLDLVGFTPLYEIFTDQAKAVQSF